MSDDDGRRVKRYQISLDVLACTCRDGYRVSVERGIPPGARVVGAYLDMDCMVLTLLVEHESFPVTPFGNRFPLADAVTFTLDFLDAKG